MKNNNSIKGNDPIDDKEKVQKSNDEHIDQDFEGYPNNPSKENIINPKTKEDRLTAKTEKPGQSEAGKKTSTKKGNTKLGKP